MTLSTIKQLNIDVGSNVARYPNLTVPTMSEYLITCKMYGLVPVVEIKEDTYTKENLDKFIKIIRELGLENKCVVICFSKEICTEIRKRSKAIAIQVLLTISQVNLDFVKSLGNAGIDTDTGNVNKQLIELAHSNGILVNVWTVNDQLTANRLIDWGVDFITTDKLVWGY